MTQQVTRWGWSEKMPWRIGGLAPMLAALGFAAVLLGSAEAQAQCAAGEWDDGGVCTVCGCGNYCPDGTNQLPCSAGRFNPSTGSSASSACMDCAAGSFSTGGACACDACDPGFFQSSTGQSSCLACAGGTFTASPGSVVCAPCPNGTFAAGSGNSTCTDCSPGTFNPASGSAFCPDCGLGTFAATPGNSACTSCSPGTFAGVTGSTVCPDCLECTFQPNSGASACFECGCDDGDVCTLDSCDMIDGTCSNDPIAGCGNAVPGLPVGGLLLVALGMAGAALLALRPRTS